MSASTSIRIDQTLYDQAKADAASEHCGNILDNLSRLHEPRTSTYEVEIMQTIQVGEFKARFSEIIEAVRAGETVVVSYGRGRENVAALIPYNQLPASEPRALGILSGQASVAFAPDFEMSDEEFLRA